MRRKNVRRRTARFAGRPRRRCAAGRRVDQFAAPRWRSGSASQTSGSLRVLRINRQPFVQQLAGACGFSAEFFEVRPRRFGVHEVRRQRRHAAPVVDAGRDDLRQHAGAQVRRRLDAHVGAEDDARDRDRPQQFVEIGLRRVPPSSCLRLRAKVLHDDFLNVAVLRVHRAQREQRFDAFEARFADADQNAGGERHARGARAAQRVQPHRGHLVGRAVVRHAFFA